MEEVAEEFRIQINYNNHTSHKKCYNSCHLNLSIGIRRYTTKIKKGKRSGEFCFAGEFKIAFRICINNEMDLLWTYSPSIQTESVSNLTSIESLFSSNEEEEKVTDQYSGWYPWGKDNDRLETCMDLEGKETCGRTW